MRRYFKSPKSERRTRRVSLTCILQTEYKPRNPRRHLSPALEQAANKLVTLAGFPHLLRKLHKYVFFKTESSTTEISMQTVCCFNITTRLPWIPDLLCHKNLFFLHSMYIGPKLAVGIGRYFTSCEFLLFVSLCYGNH